MRARRGGILLELLRPGIVYGFERSAEGWQEWTGHGATELAEQLDYNGNPASCIFDATQTTKVITTQ